MSAQCSPPLAVCLMGLTMAACHPQAPVGLPEAVSREIRDAGALPTGTYTEVRSWEAEAGGHNTGRLVDDIEAEGGKAWEARPGADEPDTMLFGPYIEIEPGNYVAFFRIRLLDTADGEPIGTLDACVSYAQDMLSAWEVVEEDLALGRYVQVPLGFTYEGGKLECRFTWYGTIPVRIDRVMLFRLEGADLSKGLWRAPEAVLSGEPEGLAYYTEPRPFPDLFPRSARPAKTLVVCDLRKERTDTKLLVFSLQGLVNRVQPRVYCLSTSTDSMWLEHLLKRGWVEETEVVADPMALLLRFRDCFRGIVVTDPQLPASKNVATMLASVRNGLVASPRLAKQLSLPILEDLRSRWNTSVEAYEWAFESLWPELNHHVVACSWPDHLALRDYLVQHKVFIFWISGPLDGARKYASPTNEARLMEKLLAKMPVNIPVMSYPWAGKDVGIGEGPGVSLFAEFGKFLVGSIDTANLSVHSGIRVSDLRQKPAPPAPQFRRDKVYVSYIISDGDNLPVLTNSNFPQLWQDDTRGSFPVGWTLSPSASVLIPAIVDYYFSTATPNDYFLGAVSGVGYTYPDLYAKRYRDQDRQRVYDEFLDLTREYMRRSDLAQCWVMNATRPDIIARYAERIPFLTALFPDYGRRLPPGQDLTYPTARNMPVFHAAGVWRMEGTRDERVAELVADVRRMTPPYRPAFLHVFVLNWLADLPLLQQALTELGTEYVAVRPDHLAELWRRAMREEGVLVRAPHVIAGIEGTSVVVDASLRNMTEQPVEVVVSEATGLDDVSIEPKRFGLAAAEQVSVKVTGRPTSERVQLTVRSALGIRTVELRVHRIARGEIVGQWPTDSRLIPATYLEAESLAHRSGQEVSQDRASEGKEWVARKGQADPGFIVFGPYAPLQAGTYLALFRLCRLDEGTGLVGMVDTCVGGGAPQTGKREVKTEELPPGEYRWVPVLFNHPGGNFETRVEWSGVASLAVDAVAVWRME